MGDCQLWVLLSAVLLATVRASPVPHPDVYDPRLSSLELSIIKSLVEALPGDSNGGGGTPEWTILSSRSRELPVASASVPRTFEAQSGARGGEEGPDDHSLVHVALSELQPIGSNGRTQKDYRLSAEDERGGDNDDWAIVRSISTELHLRSKNYDDLNNQQGYQTPGEQTEGGGRVIELSGGQMIARDMQPPGVAVVFNQAAHQLPAEQPQSGGSIKSAGGQMIVRDMQPPGVAVAINQPTYQLPAEQTQKGGSIEWGSGYSLSRDELPPSYEDPDSQLGYQLPAEKAVKEEANKGTQGQSNTAEYYPTGQQDFADQGYQDEYQVPQQFIKRGNWNDFSRENYPNSGPSSWEANYDSFDGDQFGPSGNQEQNGQFDIDIRMSSDVPVPTSDNKIEQANQYQGNRKGNVNSLAQGKSIQIEVQPSEKDNTKNQKSSLPTGDQGELRGGTNYNIVPEPSRELQPADDDLGEIPVSIREMLPPAEGQGDVTRGSWIAVPLEGGEASEGRSLTSVDATTQDCEPGHRLVMNVCQKVHTVQLTRRYRKSES